MPGHRVVLTIDANVQWLVEDALDRAVEEHAARGGSAVLVEVATGEVIALAAVGSPRPGAGRRVHRLAPIEDTYELHLAAAGSSVEDRWVAFSRRTGNWLGPHKTAAFTPTWRGWVLDANGVPISVVGSSNGFLSVMNQTARNDWTTSPIHFRVQPGYHHGGVPDIDKLFLELSVHAKMQPGSITITPRTGDYSAPAEAAITHSQADDDRKRHRRLGGGRWMNLIFENNNLNERVDLHGYEVPFHELGRR